MYGTFAKIFNFDKYADGITEKEKEEAERTLPAITIGGYNPELHFPHQVPQTGRWIAHDRAWATFGGDETLFLSVQYTLKWEKVLRKMRWRLYRWELGVGEKRVSESEGAGAEVRRLRAEERRKNKESK